MLIETSRLIIRSFVAEDVDAFATIVADPEVMRYLGTGNPLTYDQARDYIEKYLALERTTGYSRNAVELKSSHQLVGMCGLADLNDYVDLGYRFGRDHWGLGFATEAARAVIDHGFDTLSIAEITAIAIRENSGSINVIEKLGFHHVGDEVSNDGRLSAHFVKRNPNTT